MRILSAIFVLIAVVSPTHAETLYVAAGAMGANDGSSWADAFVELQSALAISTAGDEVWVAAGTYTPDFDDARGIHTADRNMTFQMVDGVRMYGGFLGGETAISQRPLAADITILSGDLLGDDGPDFAQYEDNSYHVVIYSDPDASGVVFDGFTVCCGNADGTSFDPIVPSCQGGGIHLHDGNGDCTPGGPTISNCLIRDNLAIHHGALNDHAHDTVIHHCVFRNNRAGVEGAALLHHTGRPQVSDCWFEGNDSGIEGGAVWVNQGVGAGCFDLDEAVYTNCVFVDNRAPRGGALYSKNNSIRLRNCVFAGNSATLEGGAAYLMTGTPEFSQCTFTGNAAPNGAALFIGTAGLAVLRNTIVWDHATTPLAGAADVQHSLVAGGWPGTGNIVADPLFVQPGAWVDDSWLDGDYHLQPGSPAIDSGTNGAVPADLPFDLDGRIRAMDHAPTPDCAQSGACGVAPIADMGATELANGCVAISDCGDLDGNATRDDACLTWTCADATCLGTPIAFADVGGSFGACAVDGFVNVHDRNLVLQCFSGLTACDALHIDAGGPFGGCAPDGFCNIHDANHALAAFAGTGTCTCPAPPIPEFEPPAVARATLHAVADRRAVGPGESVAVRVFVESPAVALMGYQLELEVSGGRRGDLVLSAIAIESRRDAAFSGHAPFTANNLGTAQVLAGLDAGAATLAAHRHYLATFHYVASTTADGQFVVRVRTERTGQTFLVARHNGRIEVDGMEPAVVGITQRRR